MSILKPITCKTKAEFIALSRLGDKPADPILRISHKYLWNIYRHSPVRVNLVDAETMRDLIGGGPGSEPAGCFKADTKPVEIFIYNGLPNREQLPTFFHELGHYFCWKFGCKCFGINAMCEYHAQRFALATCVNAGLVPGVYGLINQVGWMGSSSSGTVAQYYKTMAKRMMKTRLWTIANQFLVDNGCNPKLLWS